METIVLAKADVPEVVTWRFRYRREWDETATDINVMRDVLQGFFSDKQREKIEFAQPEFFLFGYVYNHDGVEDMTDVATSPIKKIQRVRLEGRRQNGFLCKTRNSVYLIRMSTQAKFMNLPFN